MFRQQGRKPLNLVAGGLKALAVRYLRGTLVTWSDDRG